MELFIQVESRHCLLRFRVITTLRRLIDPGVTQLKLSAIVAACQFLLSAIFGGLLRHNAVDLLQHVLPHLMDGRLSILESPQSPDGIEGLLRSSGCDCKSQQCVITVLRLQHVLPGWMAACRSWEHLHSHLTASEGPNDNKSSPHVAGRLHNQLVATEDSCDNVCCDV